MLWLQSAYAAGGTAQPPIPGRGVIPELSTKAPLLDPPTFTASSAPLRPFTVVGFIQKATLWTSADTQCPAELDAQRFGGIVVVNDLLITIPCNAIVQMPAATFKWAELFDPGAVKTTRGLQPLDLAGRQPLSPVPGAFTFPSIEIKVVGNIVAGRHIAGLVYISQQSLNTSSGYITGLDYAKSVIYVASSPDQAAQVRLQIVDLNGRFSNANSVDSRFNVDDANPTIRSVTGYPMCVPRQAPATTSEDRLCPQRNRPLVVNGCRNFADAGWQLPAGRDLAPPIAGQTYCSSFVMGDPLSATTGQPLSTEQAPFAIGDFITFSGTMLNGDHLGPQDTETIAVHTVIANVGIYTQPGSMPVYIALDEFSVASFAPRNFGNIPQEANETLVVNAFVTDISSTVDIYFIDQDAIDGTETNRWLTPLGMTGGTGTTSTDGSFTYIDGGITTQFGGPVPGRVRLRATKSIPTMLTSPTRYLRAVTRQLCDPVNINKLAPLLIGSGPPTPCLERAPAANNLFTGQYLAPVTDFIFPENIVPGDPTVPYPLWTLNFLARGEGALGAGPLVPKPW